VTRRMALVADPGSGRRPASTNTSGNTVIMRGDGNASFDCGGCDAPIPVGVAVTEVERYLFRCSRCGATLRIAN
jgi:hypothetical protein